MDADAVAAVAVFPWLHNPQPDFSRMALTILLEVGRELLPGLVVKALDMEGDWQVLEHILALLLVKCLHAVIQCFLVAQILVVLKMVMELSIDELATLTDSRSFFLDEAIPVLGTL